MLYQRIIRFPKADFVSMQTNKDGQIEIRLCGEKNVDVRIVPNYLERVELKALITVSGKIANCLAFYKDLSLPLEIEIYHLLDQVDKLGNVSFTALKKAGISSPIEPLVPQANFVLNGLGVKQRLVVEKRRVKIK